MKLENILKNTKLKIAAIGLAGFLAFEGLNSCVPAAHNTIFPYLICSNQPDAEIYADGILTNYIPKSPTHKCIEKWQGSFYRKGESEKCNEMFYCSYINLQAGKLTVMSSNVILKKEGYIPTADPKGITVKGKVINIFDGVIKNDGETRGYLFEFKEKIN